MSSSGRSRRRLFIALVALAPALESAAPPPGVHIERASPGPEAEAARARLIEWHRLYVDRLAALRRSAARLFAELERSSLATLTDRCTTLLERVGEVDRAALFPSTDVDLDRVLFGSLERYRAGAAECLAGRFLSSYRLLLEARAGLEWVDGRIERRLRPPVRLRGLDPPE